MTTGANDMMWLNVEKEDGSPVATCPVEVTVEGPGSTPEFFAESVVDSSRYFVLRIVDATSKRVAFIGMGFRERHEAMRFKETMQDHVRYVKRQRLADIQTAAFDELSIGGGAAAGPKKFALGDGAKITMSAAGLPPKQRKKTKAKKSGSGGGGFKGLAAPRAGGVQGLPAKAKAKAKPAAAATTTAADDDEDWGDFQ